MSAQIAIDPDLWIASEEYVSKQLQIMRNCGSAPSLTPVEHADLVYKCAKYPQDIRNLDAKIERKRRLAARSTGESQPKPKEEL